MELPGFEVRADGLAWAYAFPPDAPHGPGEPLPPGAPGWDWLHYDLVQHSAHATIHAMPELPPFARMMLVGTDETPHVSSDGETVAGVLPSFAASGGSDRSEIVWWRFAMRPGRLVTGRRRPARALAGMWHTLKSGRAPGGPQALLYAAVAEFARDARRRVAALDDTLDATEQALLDQSATADLTGLGATLGQARREVTTIKRALTPLTRLLAADAEALPGWACDDGRDAAHAAVAGALDDIVALQDRAHSLYDELTDRRAEETNRRLYIVSIVTTVVLPASFVTGFFGMNTGGMLWTETGLGTVYGLGLCLAAMLVTLLVLRWKRLL